jgi:hypothetical protein
MTDNIYYIEIYICFLFPYWLRSIPTLVVNLVIFSGKLPRENLAYIL